MDRFCILLVDRTGRVLEVDEIEAESERDAIERASRHRAVGSGFEVWRGDQKVYAHFDSRLSFR